MTIKEAIMLLNPKTTASALAEIEYYNGFSGKEACIEAIEDACRLAIEALEKQVPNKPDYEGDGYADGELVYDTWICPRCGRRYEVDYDDYRFCPNCGQAIKQDIDWSDEK